MTAMGSGGVYREIAAPERLVSTERFAVLKSGMETGVTASYDRLADLGASTPARERP
jgi:hypothetical protein